MIVSSFERNYDVMTGRTTVKITGITTEKEGELLVKIGTEGLLLHLSEGTEEDRPKGVFNRPNVSTIR